MTPVAQAEASGPTDLPWLTERKWLRIMEPRVRAALQAARDALGQTALPTDTGLVVAIPDLSWNSLHQAPDWQSAPPLWLLTVLPNSPAGHLSRTFAITGPVLTCTTIDQARQTAADWLADHAAASVLVVELAPATQPARARCEIFLPPPP
ncbi:MAG: hypothetical protein SNJ84_07445 [Verrucomicrobiia bacterium]